MTGLPAIQAAAAIALAGMDHRTFMRTRDNVERLAEVAIADVVTTTARTHEDARRKALAAEVGGRVGQVVGRALSSALRSMARAFSR